MTAVLAGCSMAEGAVEELVGSPEPPPHGAASELCRAMRESLDVDASDCDQAILADCEEVVATFSTPFVVALQACIEMGGGAAACLGSSADELQPGPSHYQLAASYCEVCLLDAVDDCETIFFNGEEGLGSLFVPLSEEVVDDIRVECASTPLACAVDFMTCAQEVLKERVLPDHTAWCLLEEAL